MKSHIFYYFAKRSSSHTLHMALYVKWVSCILTETPRCLVVTFRECYTAKMYVAAGNLVKRFQFACLAKLSD